MAYYRISFEVGGHFFKGIKESDKDLREMYLDYEMRLNHRYGAGRIIDYDCVQLYEKSPLVLNFIKKNDQKSDKSF